MCCAVSCPAVLQALGLAAVKAVVAIVGITAGGRMFIRPLYKKISNMQNSEIFAATTLLVVLGTSFMTQLAGESQTHRGPGGAASCGLAGRPAAAGPGWAEL